MTDNQIIIEVAKLDGFESGDNKVFRKIGQENPFTKSGQPERDFKDLPDYLTSRDAIIPVILKVRPAPATFLKELCQQWKDTNLHTIGLQWFDYLYHLIGAEPRQLGIALVKATGKWVE